MRKKRMCTVQEEKRDGNVIKWKDTREGFEKFKENLWMSPSSIPCVEEGEEEA
jgi:hypothetical protein